MAHGQQYRVDGAQEVAVFARLLRRIQEHSAA